MKGMKENERGRAQMFLWSETITRCTICTNRTKRWLPEVLSQRCDPRVVRFTSSDWTAINLINCSQAREWNRGLEAYNYSGGACVPVATIILTRDWLPHRAFPRLQCVRSVVDPALKANGV